MPQGEGEMLREKIFKEFIKIFSVENVITKQRVSTGTSDDLIYSMYTPEPDVIVLPRNTRRQVIVDNNTINSAYHIYKKFFDAINKIAVVKFNEHNLNPNPRYLIALEAGGSGNMKHLLGDIVNASILGKIGIVVGTNKKMVDSYKRIIEYLNFAYDVGKNKQHFDNVVILEQTPFLNYLSKYNN